MYILRKGQMKCEHRHLPTPPTPYFASTRVTQFALSVEIVVCMYLFIKQFSLEMLGFFFLALFMHTVGFVDLLIRLCIILFIFSFFFDTFAIVRVLKISFQPSFCLSGSGGGQPFWNSQFSLTNLLI